MEATQDTATTAQSNISRTLSAVDDFDAKWKAFQDRFDSMTNNLITGLQQHAAAAAQRISAQQEREVAVGAEESRLEPPTTEQWRAQLPHAVPLRDAGKQPLSFSSSRFELPYDCWVQVLGKLPVRELVLCMQLSRAWHEMSRSDALWAEHCDRLWATKTYVPQLFRDMRSPDKAGHCPAEAFRLSVIDSSRTWLTGDELISATWWNRVSPGTIRAVAEIPESLSCRR